jgi:hypothetical protein
MILKLNFRVEIILLIIILILMVCAPMLLSCTNHSPYKLLEGFVEGFVEGVANTLKEDEENKTIPQMGGSTPTTVTNKKTSNGKKEGFSNFKKKPDIPLIFNDSAFRPDCCPNTYSNSMGCLCMTQSQYRYLINRGGNNIPYSEY